MYNKVNVSYLHRAQAVSMSVRLLSKFSKLYKDLCTYKHVFSPVLYMLNQLPTDNYPDSLQVGRMCVFIVCTVKGGQPRLISKNIISI